MSDDATPRLGLPYLAAAQAQKHVTLNEALAALDGLVQTAVASRSTAAEPAAPADGALYVLPAGATGADWAGRPAGTLMRFEADAWTPLAVPVGALAYVADEQALALFDGAAWRDAASAIHALQNLAMLGVGTTADANNPLAVKGPAVLVDNAGGAAGGGVQLKVNKATAADVGSVLFQTGYAARAEAGLVGDDQLRLRVADDGGAWRDALVVDRESGAVSLAGGIAAVGAIVVSPGAGLYPTTLTLQHGGHPVSRRTSLNMDYAWEIDSDTGANGTMDFGIYNISMNIYQLLLPRSGGLLVQGREVVTAQGLICAPSCARAALPSAASQGAGAVVFVPDEAGGATLAFSDGAAWRRVGDRAVVS